MRLPVSQKVPRLQPVLQPVLAGSSDIPIFSQVCSLYIISAHNRARLLALRCMGVIPQYRLIASRRALRVALNSPTCNYDAPEIDWTLPKVAMLTQKRTGISNKSLSHFVFFCCLFVVFLT